MELNKDKGIKLRNLIVDYSDIFSAKNPGATVLITHHIDIGSNKPINQAPYRRSRKGREIIRNEVQRMLDENIQIQTVNTSAPKVFSAAANSARIGGTR